MWKSGRIVPWRLQLEICCLATVDVHIHYIRKLENGVRTDLSDIL